MNNQRKRRLMDLGTEVLADALLQLANCSEAADDLVNRLIASPEENIQRFKAKLSRLKRLRRFIHWEESTKFARELTALLHDLAASVDDPETGVELVLSFYETDKRVLGNCDDSNGHVGNVYRFDAKELFVGYASRCEDKAWLAKLVLKLNQEDDYGIRDTLVDCAVAYLPESNIRTMIAKLQKWAEREDDKYDQRRWLMLVESLARQIKDAPLFEQTRSTSWDELPTAACVDIAQVYLESGDAEIALSWLERIPEGESFQARERDHLLLTIYGQLGEPEKQAAIAWRIFRRYRSVEALQKLLAVIGKDQWDAAVTDEVTMILNENSLSLSDAAFLIELERVDEAEGYLLERTDQLNGDYYENLIPLAESLERGKYPLSASMIYRALLDSILHRGQSKTYPHGVRYLKKLDRLATTISEWRGMDDHKTYLKQLRQTHGRKRSFWSRYKK